MSQQPHENEPTRDLDPQDERSACQNPHQHLAPESDMRRRQCSPRRRRARSTSSATSSRSSRRRRRRQSGYDYRADLKEAHAAIVRARDEGELSLAAAQLKVCFVAPPKKAIPA